MDLELTRIDYGNIGTTCLNCLKLLPNEYKKQQKVVVGDLDGTLQVFSIKKSEAQLHFQNYIGKKICSIQLGGAIGSPMDKLFVASETIVKAYNRKGKMFLSFDTNLTEPIKCMFVSGPDLITCGNHVYNHYRDCKDIGTYLCGDTIVDVVGLVPNNTNRILTILACSGRVLRILEHCRVRQTIELDSVPTTLHVPKNNLQGDKVLCGFADGKVVLFLFGHFTGEVKQQTIIKPDSNPSAVTCIDTFDLSGDEKIELIIGRRDGTVQVFTMPTEDEFELEPRQLYKECFPESISAVQGGCVFAANFVEIVVLSYSGNIFGLTSQVISVSLSDKEIIREPLTKTLNSTKFGTTIKNKDIFGSTASSGSGTLESASGIHSIASYSSDSKVTIINNAETEEPVKLSLVKPRENYRLQTQIVTPAISASVLLEVNDVLFLRKEDGSYFLSIEMAVSIIEILFQSESFVDLINEEKNAAELIKNPVELGSTCQFSMTARIQGNRNRFEMEFHTIEGQYGSIEAYILPNVQPSVVQPRSYLVRPLSLHMRIHSFDETRPFNVLTLKGSFTQAEMHSWIEQCIPEVPERLAVGETTELYFKHVLINTILEAKYGKGSAEFRSDNLSTISILKDFLTKEATKRRIKLEMNTEISEPSVGHVLKLIEPKILKCIKIKTDHKFLMALLQVNIRNEEDFNCLMPEYQSILKRRTEIEIDFKDIPMILNRYFGIITDFYIDRFKFKGIFVKNNVTELIRILENYEYSEVLDFFTNYKTKENNVTEL